MLYFAILSALILLGIFYPPLLIGTVFIAIVLFCFIPTPKSYCGKLETVQELHGATKADEENPKSNKKTSSLLKHEDFQDDDYYNPKNVTTERKTTLKFKDEVNEKNAHPEYLKQMQEIEQQNKLSNQRTKKNIDFVKKIRERDDANLRRWALSTRPDPNIIQYYTPEHAEKYAVNGASVKIMNDPNTRIRGFNAKQ